jgi:NTE family protein
MVLSAGFFGFYGHAGFLKGLAAAGLAPTAYAGTSAGALVAAYAAAGLSMREVEEVTLQRKRHEFWDPDPIGAVQGAASGFGLTGLLKGERLRTLLGKTLPAATFEGLKHPLLVVATNITRGAPAIFTSGPLAPRLHASCAYPGLFRSVHLEGEQYWDGGLVDKAPALALAESEAGRDLDAILVHYLPSRTRTEVHGPLAYARGMAAGMAGLRRDHFRLQLEVLKARGVKVYTVVSVLPPVSPSSLEEGFSALDQARVSCERALARPPREFELL